MAYPIVFTPRAQGSLAGLRKRDQQVIVDTVDMQLTHEPTKPTRNRKRLEDNPLAPWELRVGRFRAFYDVDEERATVVIVAIGHKVHNKLYIGDEEIDL